MYPGSFCSESSEQAVETRDPKKLVIPERAYAFWFASEEVIEGTLSNGEKILVKTAPYNVSGQYFINGEIFDQEQIIALQGKDSILASNMKSNRMKHVVKTRFNQFMEFKDGD
jgi:hypothetical protein